MRVNSINNQPQFKANYLNLLKRKNNQRILNGITANKISTKMMKKNNKAVALPLVATPLVAYMSSTHSERIQNKLTKEASNVSDKSFTNEYNKSIEALEKAGIKTNFDQYIDSKTGRLNISGNNITSKGGSPYETYSSDTTTDLDVSDDIITDSVKDFVSDALPVYNAARVIQKVCEGDEEEIVKQSVGVIDNVVCQPVKQAVASAVAAKGALIGSIFGPIGAGAGAVIGYAGTLLGWGKARNSIVKKIMKKD